MPTITVDIRAVGAEGVSRSMEQAARSIGQNLPRAAATAERAVTGLTGRMEVLASVTARVRSQAVGAFAGFIGAGALAGATKSIIDASNAMIGFRNSLEAAAGGSEGAAKSLAFVRFESERLGLSLETSARQFASISNSARGTALEGDGVQKVFTSIAQAARVMNLSNDSVQGAFVAISQMMGKGAIMAEELRGQLAERIPGAVKIMADGLGVGIAELNKMMETGLRGEAAYEAVRKFAEELDRVYSIQAMNAANSPAAEFARLGNAIFDLKNAIGSSGLMDSLAGISRGFTEGIRGIIEGGWIDKITEGMKALAVAIGVAFGGKTLEFIGSFVTKMGDATKAIGLQRAETIKLAQARVADAMANEAALKATAAKASQAVVDAQANVVKKTSIRTIEAYELALKREAAALRNVTLATLETTMAGRGLNAAIATQTGLMASLSAAAAKAGAAIKTAFAAIGGWFTVAIAGIYGVYKAYEYLTTGTEESAKATEKATTLIDQNARANERLIVQLRGVSEENANTIVAFDELNASIAASTARLGELQAKYEGMSTFETVSRFANLANPRGVVADVAAWVTGGDSTLKDTTEIIKNREAIEEATKARQELANSIIHTAQVQEAFAASQGKSSDALENALKILELNGVSADILSAALANSSERMADAARNALNLAVANDKEAIAQGTASAAVIAAIDTYAAAGVQMTTLIQILEEAGAAQAYFNALFERGGAVAQESASNALSEATQKYVDRLQDEQAALVLSKEEMIRYNAAKQIAAVLEDTSIKNKEAEIAIIIEANEAMVRSVNAMEARKSKVKGLTEEEKALRNEMRELDNLMQRFPDALEAVQRRTEELVEADGAYTAALKTRNRDMRQAEKFLLDAAKLYRSGSIGIDQWTDALAKANALVKASAANYDRTTAAIERQVHSIGGMIDAYSNDALMAGMTDHQRAIAEAVADATKYFLENEEAVKKNGYTLEEYQRKAAGAADAAYTLAHVFDIIQGEKSPFEQMVEDVNELKAALERLPKKGEEGFIEGAAESAAKAIDILNHKIDMLRQQGIADAIGGFKDMAGAMTSLFRDGSKEAQRMQQIVAVAAVAEQAALLPVAIANATNAILNQGKGEPYTAFARMAAMAAAVAPLVASIGGAIAAFGGGSSGPSAAQRQETQGTGTVLGDAAAKSESIVNAVEITANATQQLVGINRGMLRALQSMQEGLGSAAGMLARGAGDAAFGGISSGGNYRLPTAANFAFGGLIGVTLDKLFGNMMNRVLSNILGGKESLRDTGIRIVGGTLSQMIDDIMVQAYQTIHRSGGWFRSSRDYDRFTTLGDDVSRQFQMVLGSMADAVRAAADALGIDMDEINARIAAFKIEEIRISTMDLSAEEAQKELEAVFSKIFDGLAGSVVPWIDEFQQVGEGLGETLVRVATGVQVMQEAMKQLGFALDETDPLKFARISEGLIGLMGGIDGFIEGMSAFVNAFATDEHKFRVAQEAITSAFAQFGLTIPETRDGMWELMQSLDATTEEGRKQIAMLLELAGAADAYYAALEKGQKAYQDFINQFRVENGAPADGSGAGSVSEAIRQSQAWAQYMIDEANRLAIAAGLAGAAEEDLALIHQRAADAVADAQAKLVDAYNSFMDQFRPSLVPETGENASTIDEAIRQSQEWAQYMIDEANRLAIAAGVSGAAESDLALIRERAAEYAIRAAEKIAEAQAQAAKSYDELAQSIGDQLAELRGASEYAQEMARIDRQLAENVDTLNKHAIAAGRAGASEEDLARALEVATLARAKALQALQAEAQELANTLYGTPLSRLEAEIAELEAQGNAASIAIVNVGDAMAQAARDASEAMGLLLGSYSPLRAVDKLPLALDALRRGETDANTVLGIARDVYGSGRAYNEVFEEVMRYADRQQGGTDGGGGQQVVGVSPEMERLLKERDALLAEQAKAERFMQASQLAAMVTQLSSARGEDYASIAESLGFSLEQFSADLNLDGIGSLTEYLDELKKDQDTIGKLFELPTTGDLAIVDAINALRESLIAQPENPPTEGIDPVVRPIPVRVESPESIQQAADIREVRDLLRVLIDRGVTANEDTATATERTAEAVARLAVVLESDSIAAVASDRRGV